MIEIVVNPNGASGKACQVWEKTEPLFRKSGKEYHVFFSDEQKSVTEIVQEVTARPCDLVIVGGDGTLNQAVNGIRDFEHVRLGLIPIGSGNDFARSQKYEGSLTERVDRILSGKNVRSIDLGEVVYQNRFEECEMEQVGRDGFVHRRFVISAGIGFDASICHEAGISKYKKVLNRLHMGKLIYILTAIHIIAATKRVKAWVTMDGKEREFDSLLLAVVMNEPYEGGGFRFCPSACDSDSLLDFCLADHLTQFDFFRIFPYAYKGAHLKFEGVESGRVTEMNIRTEVPLWVHTDGETACMSSDITIHLCEEKLNLLY